MTKTKTAVASHRRRKRIRNLSKGFFGDRKNHARLTKEAVMRALTFNYIHRKRKKREMRSLWICRINIAARLNGISYSKLINGLLKAQCGIDRKILADLAVRDPKSFAAIAHQAKTALAV